MLRKIQKTMANDILSKTPAAQRNLERLEQRNKALAKLVKRGVPQLYYKYKTPEAASKGITEMIDRALRVDYALKELGIKKINPRFVHTVLHEKVITIGDIVQIKRKLDELERISKQKAEGARQRVQGFLSLSVQDALKYIDGEIYAAKRNHIQSLYFSGEK